MEDLLSLAEKFLATKKLLCPVSIIDIAHIVIDIHIA